MKSSSVKCSEQTTAIVEYSLIVCFMPHFTIYSLVKFLSSGTLRNLMPLVAFLPNHSCSQWPCELALWYLAHDNLVEKISKMCLSVVIPRKSLPQDNIPDKHCDPWERSLSASKSRLQSFLSIASRSLSRVIASRRGCCLLTGHPIRSKPFNVISWRENPIPSLPRVVGRTKCRWTVWMMARHMNWLLSRTIVCLKKPYALS